MQEQVVSAMETGRRKRNRKCRVGFTGFSIRVDAIVFSRSGNGESRCLDAAREQNNKKQ